MFSPWIPDLSDSIDGKPLATNMSDLWTDFPYDRLPENNIVRFVLMPEGMLAMLAFYLVSKPLFKSVRSLIDPKSALFTASVAVHNLALAIFSLVVAVNSWPVVYQHFQKYGFFLTYCDPNGTLWNEVGLGPWALIFYLSKYYEFVDTWVLIFKGKEPSFLQVYHHTGVAFGMWIGVASQSAWLKYVTLLNSVIHTLMYTYFFIKTINPKAEIKIAKNLTMAQIGQFLFGIIVTIPMLYLGDECGSASSRFGLVFLLAYVWGLVFLFAAFAKRKYKKP